jgi:hypothetical protein
VVESSCEASGDGDVGSSFSTDGGIRFLLKALRDWKAGSVAVRDGDEGPSLILPPHFCPPELNWSLFGFHGLVKEQVLRS